MLLFTDLPVTGQAKKISPLQQSPISALSIMKQDGELFGGLFQIIGDALFAHSKKIGATNHGSLRTVCTNSNLKVTYEKSHNHQTHRT